MFRSHISDVARSRFGHVVLAVALVSAMVVGISSVAVSPTRAETLVVALDRLEIVTAKGRTSFSIEIVDTEESRARGLMFRKSMADDHGMLFDFRREEPVWFWMKNTYLPLDMIFARADGTIVSIARDATPLSEAAIASGGAVRFVFEVNAGGAARLGLSPGDRLVHPRIRVGP